MPSIGERPLLVPEQFAGEQRFRERTAVGSDERTVAPGAESMQQPCDTFLADPAFARNQHAGVGRGCLRYDHSEVPNGGALPENPVGARHLFHLDGRLQPRLVQPCRRAVGKSLVERMNDLHQRRNAGQLEHPGREFREVHRRDDNDRRLWPTIQCLRQKRRAARGGRPEIQHKKAWVIRHGIGAVNVGPLAQHLDRRPQRRKGGDDLTKAVKARSDHHDPVTAVAVILVSVARLFHRASPATMALLAGASAPHPLPREPYSPPASNANLPSRNSPWRASATAAS
jgi:hypothetical protein